MSAEWYYRNSSGTFGPLPPKELKRAAKAGELLKTDEIRREDQTKWVKAARLKGLFQPSTQVKAEHVGPSSTSDIVAQTKPAIVPPAQQPIVPHSTTSDDGDESDSSLFVWVMCVTGLLIVAAGSWVVGDVVKRAAIAQSDQILQQLADGDSRLFEPMLENDVEKASRSLKLAWKATTNEEKRIAIERGLSICQNELELRTNSAANGAILESDEGEAPRIRRRHPTIPMLTKNDAWVIAGATGENPTLRDLQAFSEALNIEVVLLISQETAALNEFDDLLAYRTGRIFDLGGKWAAYPHSGLAIDSLGDQASVDEWVSTVFQGYTNAYAGLENLENAEPRRSNPEATLDAVFADGAGTEILRQLRRIREVPLPASNAPLLVSTRRVVEGQLGSDNLALTGPKMHSIGSISIQDILNDARSARSGGNASSNAKESTKSLSGKTTVSGRIVTPGDSRQGIRNIRVALFDSSLAGTAIPSTTYTDANGRFSIAVPSGWIGKELNVSIGEKNNPRRIYSSVVSASIDLGNIEDK